MPDSNALATTLRALHFAAECHRDQRRKGIDEAPYVNHLIEVMELLVSVGGVTDPVTLAAAALHDVLEDTDTPPAELERRFGAEVRRVVEELTDDEALPWQDRKQAQIDHAPHLSPRARAVKLADKISNIRGIRVSPPAGWSVERRRRYAEWGVAVVAGIRGSNLSLERRFDEVVAETLRSLNETGEAPGS